ncbi:MAG TPA: extracellular solute-binding protein [Bacteroidetes bacterium]|nr:bacterial extracellular solute-binding protein [bacterium BMS3Bbin04]HDO64984.1 extracellular solute-binding protein [Bacteroidota bacterium]HEX04109.1 extracellular solute-binding protein [Bacteroidota bacterium]
MVRQRAIAVSTCLILASIGLVLLSCTRSQESDGVQLLLWSSTNPPEMEHARALVTEWNLAHPDTFVTLQPIPEGRSGEEVLIIAAAGGTAPDICTNIPPIIAPLLADAGSLLPLDSINGARQAIEARVPEEVLATFIDNDGLLYQIPWKGNPILIQYNTTMLHDAGVDSLPQTWSEFAIAADKVTVDLDGDGAIDRRMTLFNPISEWRQRLFDFYPFFIASTGGETLLNGTEVNFDRLETERVFRFFQNGFERNWFSRSLPVGDPFVVGEKFASRITGPWNIAYTERFKGDNFEYEYGPIPVPDDYVGPKFTFGDPKSIGIFSTTDHPDAAWAFVDFYTSRSADLRLLEITSQLPLRRDLLSDSLYTEFFSQNPRMVQFAEQIPNTRGFDQNPVLQEVFDAIAMQFDAVCVHSRRTPEEGVEKAANRSRTILRLRGNK